MVAARVQVVTRNISIGRSHRSAQSVVSFWEKLSRKKVKSASPALVEICTGVFSCRTAGHDRCFVTRRSALWLCTRKE